MSIFPFENLPDEIILKVIRNLEYRDIIVFSQLSKRIRTICQDESLWKKINLYGKRVPTEFLQLILGNGISLVTELIIWFVKIIDMLKIKNLKWKYIDFCDFVNIGRQNTRLTLNIILEKKIVSKIKV